MGPDENLRLLSILHYVLAGLAGLFSLIPLVYVGIGVLVLRGAFNGPHPPVRFMGWIFIAIGLLMVFMGLAFAGLVVLSGSSLARRRHWTFIVVMAGLSCAFFPLGTVLGILTIVAVSKPEVKVLFEAPGTGSPARASGT